jgi:hypothetical protein
MSNDVYMVYRLNKFNDNLTDELIANFYGNLELAKDFCNYQATLHDDCYAVYKQDLCVYNPNWN